MVNFGRAYDALWCAYDALCEHKCVDLRAFLPLLSAYLCENRMAQILRNWAMIFSLNSVWQIWRNNLQNLDGNF
jgi:hypothetical protein